MKTKVTLIVILATLLYAVIGGVIFHYIEQPYETNLLPQVLEELSQYTTDGGGCLNWTDFIRLKGILSDLEDSGYYISFSGQLVNGTKWDVRTSIFAAISVFTSVGFHRLAPDYTWGRVFCIFYSWLGIPLFFAAIKTSGKLGSRGLKVIRRRLCATTLPKREGWFISNFVGFVVGFVLLLLIPAVIFSHLERWSYAEAIYFCFSTLFTIGFGDYMPGFNREVLPSEDFLHWYRLATAFWVLIMLTWFLSYVLRLLNLIDQSADESEILIDRKLADIKETPKSEAIDARWAHGTTVMINGDKPKWPTAVQGVLPSSTLQFPVATGSPGGDRPTHTGGLVNVISVSG